LLLAPFQVRKDDDEETKSPDGHSRRGSLTSQEPSGLAQGLWKAKVRLGDVIMINGVTFRVVRKEDVFKPVVRIPTTTTTASGELGRDKLDPFADIDNSNEDVSRESDLSPEELAKRKKEDLTELETLLAAKGEQAQTVDPWCVEPPTFPEMNELDFTADHIALDRPWVLPDTQNLEVFKVVPSMFYEIPGKLAASAVVRSYPIQKAVAIAAITCHKIASRSRTLAVQFDEDSESAARLKTRAVNYDIYSNNWLINSRSIVHMSYDFTLRRSAYRFVRLLGRGVAIMGALGYHRLKQKTKKKVLTPYQTWETSKAKIQIAVYIATVSEEDEDMLLGLISIDPKAPADILREYIRRNFQEALNESPWGDSFLFSKEKKGHKPEVFPRAIEPKKYTKDVTVLRMDHETMETGQCVMLVAEPHVGKVMIEIPPDVNPEDEDLDVMGENKDKKKKEAEAAKEKAEAAAKEAAAKAAAADPNARKARKKKA
jgi:hypothetical protein